MKAIVQEVYGEADVLALGEVERPVPGDREVLVRVRAAGVDRGVWHLMAGLPYLVRAFGYGVRRPKSRVPGNDVAGIVEAVGREVARFRPGDEVFGLARGSFAEYACGREARMARKPANLSFEEAAAAPVSGLTALQSIRVEAKVRPGQSVAILGASGGVGTFAVQIAKAWGAEVTGVCSAAKADLVRSLGADRVLDYARESLGDDGRRYDVVLDLGGNRPLARLRRALAPGGTLVLAGGEHGGRWLGGMERSLAAALLSPFVRETLRPQFPKAADDDLDVLAGLLASGKVRPVVDRAFPLAEAPDAIRHLVAGRARGKVVVTVAT